MFAEPAASEGPEAAQAPEWMTDAEVARLRRLRRPADRADYAASHWLVRCCAAEILGADPRELTLVQHCAGCGARDHGPPALLGTALRISLSHTRGYVAAIASQFPCGIDVEHTGGPVLPRALHPAERVWLDAQPDRAGAFARLWVRKEALVKAGRGTLDRVAEIDALTPGAGVRMGEWVEGRAAGPRGAWCERVALSDPACRGVPAAQLNSTIA